MFEYFQNTIRIRVLEKAFEYPNIRIVVESAQK